MNTYLLTWKSTKWDYEYLRQVIVEFNAGAKVHRWSCGSTKSIAQGSRVFLMRQGKGEKGIFGSGHVVKSPYEDEHYNETKKDAGKTALYVSIEFDELFDPMTQIKIGTDTLMTLDESVWNSQGSGKSIDSKVAFKLEEVWKESLGYTEITDASELTSPNSITEGAKKTIIVNAYERSRKARRICIEEHGLQCTVCNFHFELFYGKLGAGFIHLHHLKPIADIGEEYLLDPVADLRPVCPNCHAMLHRTKDKQLSIEELKAELAKYRNDVRI
jgi:5-methylcytosine-specific restriction protein A